MLVSAVTATSPFLSMTNVSPEHNMWSSGSDGCVRQTVPSVHRIVISLPSPSMSSSELSGIAALRMFLFAASIITEQGPRDFMLYFFRRMQLVYRWRMRNNRFRIVLLFA